jgi:hypothetical protein
MTISTAPDFPAIGDPAFNAKAYAWAVFMQQTFTPQINAAGIAMGITGVSLASGVADFLAMPTSANFRTMVEDQNSLGYLNIPQNSNSANYTCVLGDAGKQILHPSADTTARTFTIPANATVPFPVGTAITFINQHGGGVITLVATTDTVYREGSGATGNRSLAANGLATYVKITATEWLACGGSSLT